MVVALDTANGTLAVTERRDGRRWIQKAGASGRVSGVEKRSNGLRWVWTPQGQDLAVEAALRMEPESAEFVLELTASGSLPRSLAYPHPFVTGAGSELILPMNEGIGYPVDDPEVSPAWLVAYGGHGICMSFWAVTDGEASQMAIIETPDDAAINIKRMDNLLCAAPIWESQKGQFGYTRRLRFVFLKGDHVAVCKRYRRYAREIGRFKTLEEKRSENPDVDLLIGAVNVWCWESDALGIVRDLKAVGIDRILWSRHQPPAVVEAMNAMTNVLTSRYDIYQDLMDPEVVRTQLRGVHPDWTQEAWPHDIMLDENGQARKGWQVRGRDGQMHPCAVLCDARAVGYAKARVPADLQTHPYQCRFIDTTTASPWRECYSPDHPMTRSDSRHWKMELLRYMSEEAGLVTGSETGHDAAVPFVHYFEGMLSLGSYRVPDAGRDMARIWTEVPERVAKFQLGQRYRLPLWELVFHDCVVAQWYWGDYNNKLPALWEKRDLFNILYGTPPMFMFARQFLDENMERFAESYRNVCAVARQVGYAEMTDHRFLTADREVQQTAFANGVTVTVNFGDQPYRLSDGTELAAMSYHLADTNN